MGVSAAFRREPTGHSVRATIALIVAFFVLFAVVLSFAITQTYDEARRSAVSRAEASSQVVATNTKWIVELARQALQRIDATLGPEIDAIEPSTAEVIADAIDSLPGSVKAYIVAANGDTLFSTDPQVKPINITDREYFAVPAAGAAFFTSALMVSRLNGEQIFAFSKRIERGERLAGVAILSLDVKLFEEIWASLGLDRTSTVSIIRSDGQLVARYPLADGPLDLKNYILFTDYLPKSASGVYPAVSPADGVTRFVSYRRVDGTDLIALASISTESAYAQSWRNMLWMLGLSVPTALALALASLWIVRLMRKGIRRQAELADALALNQLLFRDTHHRVKNNLQSVQSLVRMQNIPPETKIDLQGRIAAMTAVHEHMYRLDQYSEIDAQALIPSIVSPLRQVFDAKAEIVTEIEPLVIDRDFATPLALLVNEVVTNALKYAFPGKAAGTIRISLARVDDQTARLTIADDGVGFDAETAVSGMGNRLIRGMVTQLGGSYSYRRDNGTVFTADFQVGPAAAGAQAKESAL